MEKVVTTTCALNTDSLSVSLSYTLLPLPGFKQRILIPSAQIHALLHKPQYYLTLRLCDSNSISSRAYQEITQMVYCRGNS